MNTSESTKNNSKSFSLNSKKYLAHAPEGVKLSPRSKLRLEDAELEKLAAFVKTEGAYATIKADSNISYGAVRDIIKNGSAQVNTVIKMRDFLKKLPVVVLIAMMALFTGCDDRHSGAWVDQDVRVSAKGLCGDEPCFATYVWYNDQIVTVWYDGALSMTDSLKQARRTEAEAILNKLKSLDK